MKDGELLFPANDVPKVDQQINELQEQVQAGKDSLRSVIFAFICLAIVLVDMLAFPQQHVIAVTFFCILEAIALLLLSKRLGIEEPTIYLVAFLKWVTRKPQ